MLAANCSDCQLPLPQGAKFCPGCGTKVVDSTNEQVKPFAELRHLTLLFSDLVDSTPLSEKLDPEDMRELLAVYQSACTSIIKRYRGYVAKYMGDGVLAYFGYPLASEDDARNGVSAGIAIVEAIRNQNENILKRFGVEVFVRVGVHTGLVVVGDIGGSSESESDAIVGKAPNLAARIQSSAKLNAVFISDDTYKLVEGFFECKDIGPLELKGISGSVQLYEAVHERSVKTRLDAMGKDLTPFTGREKERKLMEQYWETAKQGKGQVLIINGEAGVGKSRIVHSLKHLAGNEKNSWLTELRCSQYYLNSSFYPLIDMIEHVVLQFAPNDSPQVRLEKIKGWVAQYGLDNATMVNLLSSLLSVPMPEDNTGINLTPVKQKERTIELLATILIKRSREQPLIFIVEDLHWADPSTLEFLEYIIEKTGEERILSVFTHRPVFSHAWKEQISLSQITLSRFGRAESEEIIHNSAKGKKLPDEVVEYILEKTDGIPLFLEELTKMMVETGIVREVNGAYELIAPLDKLPVPATLQDSLAARLDRIKESKPVAQLAATIGREFSFEMIDSVPGEHRKNLDSHLERLVKAGLLIQYGKPPAANYVFSHALIQDSAYNTLLKSTRREFHKLIALSFELNRPELAESQPELLAHHFSEANMPAQAMGYWQKAGQLAIQRSAMPEAIAHLTKAVEQSGMLPEVAERIGGELMAQTYLGLANMQAWGYGHPDVEKAFSRARELCKILGDPPQIFPVLHGLVKFRLVRGEYEVGLDLAKQLKDTAEQTGDDNLLIEALYVVGAAEFWMGNPDASMPRFEKLISLYDPVEHGKHGWVYGEDPCVVALSHDFWQQAIGGSIGVFQKELDEAKKIVEALDHPWSTDYFHTCRTHAYAVLRDYTNARDYAHAFLDSATEHGFPWWIACASINLGWAIAHLGNIKDGLEMATQNTEMWRMMGAELAVPNFYLRVAEIHLLDKNPNEALEVLEKALNLIDKTKEGLYEAEIHRVKGVALVALGKNEEALQEINLAIELAKQRNERLWLIRAMNSHVKLSREMGQEPLQRQPLEELYNWFKEGHNLPDLAEAKALLDA